jgi:hypothetical protein
MKQDLINKISRTKFSDVTKTDIINSLTSRYLIDNQKTKINLGDSKIGGFPHLPVDFDYPIWRKVPHPRKPPPPCNALKNCSMAQASRLPHGRYK